MSDADSEYQQLKKVHPSAVLLKEGGVPVVLLPEFLLSTRGKSLTMDLLLHPSSHSGYVTRLFFQQKIDGVGDNWTTHRVIERQWWAPSWKDVIPAQPWTSMLCAHLWAVR